MKIKFLISLVLILGVSGCASSKIIRISPDTYMLTKSSAAGAFTNMSNLKYKVIQEANDFAESKGKIAIPLSTEQTVPVHGFPSYEYQFRVVDKSDPEAQRTSLVPRADFVVEKTEKISAEINTKNNHGNPVDLYTELTKLGSLREKGLLSNKEFEAEKQKLLNKRQN